MSDELKVLAFPGPEPGEKTTADVLRELARMLDEGRLPECHRAFVVFVDARDRVSPYGLGRMTPYYGAGVLMAAAQSIVNAHFAEVGDAPPPLPPRTPAA